MMTGNFLTIFQFESLLKETLGFDIGKYTNIEWTGKKDEKVSQNKDKEFE